MTTKTATKTRKAASNGNGKGCNVAEIDWTATFIEAMNAPGSLGNTYCRFYNYSFLNQIRLLMQGVSEPCATYNKWSELGRQVQKGRKAKTVLAPILVTRPLERNGVPVIVDGKPVKRQILIGFRDSRTVFVFSDTDGDELPEIELPEWDAKQALKALDVKRVRFREIDGNTAGYSIEDEKGKRLAINPAAKYPAKTLLHELAHIVLGHCKALSTGENVTHRGIAEFEAESVAYLVAKELELTTWDASESRAYIQHWLDGHYHHNEETGEAEIDNLDKHMSKVFSAANKILVAGRTTS